MGPDAEESPLPPAALGSDAPSEGRDVTGAVTALAGTRLRWQKLRRLGIAGAPAGVTNRGVPVH
jgi:hypothetical protein